MKKLNVILHINGTTEALTCSKGLLISEILQKNDIPLSTPCGGYGTCGKCKIKFNSPSPAPSPADIKQFSEKELKNGLRLACQHTLHADAELSLDNALLQGRLHILTDGIQLDVTMDPVVITKKTSEPVYGAAIDLGTSTLAVSLIDLKSGERLGKEASPNPQSIYGADIITRATAAVGSGNVMQDLQYLVIKKINELLKKLTDNRTHIQHIVLAGNTVMSHLFMGEPLNELIMAPFETSITDMQILEAKAFGIDIHPEGKITILPIIGSFIGGDIASDLLVSEELFSDDKNILLMDLGTNCELVLKTPKGMVATSAPAGPVMEGAGIVHGMLAQPGAISDLIFDEKNGFQPVTIQNEATKGICGSGLIHSIHLLWSKGVLLPEGRFSSQSSFADPKKGFAFNKQIKLFPEDIRAFQMAKSAITSSWKFLLSLFEIEEKDLDHVIMAGAFGHYIRPEAGVDLDIFPSLDKEKFIYLGNSSLTGCEMILKNRRYVKQIREIAEKTEHKEIATREDFQELYAFNMGLGKDVYF
ncbi:MAG: ASKHA domain-containing protein [Candidatus Marinimicrobia bacterium]|nr:ASKHA domain-containing protein [Candidatus Neomarinimicrobiota bacterium]